MTKLNQDDVLFINRKAMQAQAEEQLQSQSQSQGKVTFVHADDEQVKAAADKVIELFSPTLNELKDR